MFHIIYLSSAVTRFTREELHRLLEQSRQRNEEKDITGILFYRDGNFLQVLEGDEASVTSTFDRICADPRHQGVMSLFREEIPAREFGDWSMAFRDLSSAPKDLPDGYNDVLNADHARHDLSAYSAKIRAFLTMFVG